MDKYVKYFFCLIYSLSYHKQKNKIKSIRGVIQTCQDRDVDRKILSIKTLSERNRIVLYARSQTET